MQKEADEEKRNHKLKISEYKKVCVEQFEVNKRLKD